MKTIRVRHAAFILCTTVLSLVAALPASATFVIDGYDIPVVPDGLVGALGSSDSRSDVLPTPAFPFGGRDTTVISTLTGVISATIGGGQLIEISALNTGGTVHLEYDSPFNGVPVDFTSGGALYFALDLLSSSNNGTLTVELVANNNASTGPVAVATNLLPHTLLIPIPAHPDFIAASFFDIFVTRDAGGTSLSIDSIYTAVPEPTMALIWATLLGCAAAFRLTRSGVC